MKVIAIKDYKHGGTLLLENGKTYTAKKFHDRYFFPAKDKILVPRGILVKDEGASPMEEDE